MTKEEIQELIHLLYAFQQGADALDYLSEISEAHQSLCAHLAELEGY